MDLFEDSPPTGGNAPEFTVSEISGAVKRAIEGEFGHVRVRGEVGRVVRARTGHLYFDLKDGTCVLAAISWKGQAARLAHQPEEGMEVVASGRLTTYGGQSKYQMIVEDIRPAGAGALMAMLEARKTKLAAEGLFDPARKRPIPYLPEIIGVVTSPTGAVIRDILHRLRDRFPRKVLVWPVAVQGPACAGQVARAIRGFNELTPGGALPRPDLIIVARGGGSIEDLWGFNEEEVARAAAASAIPLISAVGHETDTTLIDFVSDWRAPTPTAAAEKAVPVRLELLAQVDNLGGRLTHAAARRVEDRRQRLADLSRALPRPEALLEARRQRLDHLDETLPRALRAALHVKSAALARLGLRPSLLTGPLRHERRRILDLSARTGPALERRTREARRELTREAAKLTPALPVARIARARETLLALSPRVDPAAARARLTLARERLEALDRMRQTLGYTETLARGFAVVRAEGGVVTDAAEAERHPRLEIEFRDGRVEALIGAAPKRRRPPAKDDPGPEQGSLL
ncbi:exodeoxyribonuclease VII large subunit [Wenxinia saemankumensis]|uniref:Exodeoxyribonuclease 7 large subunit n=1 Tax=Wenxinia saemankumensis TaxID=1447782 RepID=A0A1M6CKQ5_9RHOB|nr:exodeoxyribonuclease VII large subunit [Wenxinia saemankumensis]SHI61587.1 Exodeoxyribonuclease VII large subunit [Wenxinia saemankumensis]